MKAIMSSLKIGVSVAVAAGIVISPCDAAWAQNAAQAASARGAGVAAAPVLLQTGAQLSPSAGAMSNFRLDASVGLPSVQVQNPAVKAEAGASALVAPAVQDAPAAQYAPAAMAVSKAVPSAVPSLNGSVSRSVPQPAERKALRDEMTDLHDAVGAMPRLSESPAGQAHGIGIAIEDLMTRSTSRPAAEGVQARSDGSLRGALSPASRLRPSLAVGPEHSVSPAVPTPLAARALSVLKALSTREVLTPLLALAVPAILLALQFWLPAAGASLAVLAMTGIVTTTAPAQAPAYGQGSALQTEVEAMGGRIAKLKAEIGRVIVGQPDMVDSIITAMIAREHILLEGLPGVAKTRTVEAFAAALDADHQVIQGTPDKMPADLIGAEILQEDPQTGARSMLLQKGPIFAALVLVDEINRMTPKTQSALLSAMQERRVTVGRERLKLPEPFLVLATQNPLEQEGVNVLPEAQLDRFMFKVIVPQPERGERLLINDLNRTKKKVETHQALTVDELMEATEVAERVHMSDPLRYYAQDLLDAALDPSTVGVGEPGLVSQAMVTRASIFMEKAARINALMKGRSWVTPEDIREVAPKILRHRIILSYAAGDMTTDQLIQKILAAVPVPKDEK